MFSSSNKQCRPAALLGFSIILGLLVPGLQAQDSTQLSESFRIMTAVKPVPQEAVDGTKALTSSDRATAAGLPIFTFFTESPRDFLGYTGVIVGRDPFNGGGSASVAANIVPLVIVTNAVATGVGSDGHYTTVPGVTVFNPLTADNSCLADPANVPLTLFRESPLFENATFTFGGTGVGHTQYIDAFQRAQFWKALGGANRPGYHLLLKPQILTPIVINVPANHGLTRPAHLPGGRTLCGPQARIDIDWFDAYLNILVLPALSSQGVAPSNLPVFLAYNTVWAEPAIDPTQCCILGYHSGTNTIPIQTYSVVDFEKTGAFPTGISDTAIASHELAEWANDPFVNNFTPAWGHTGQVSGCDDVLEVGDPLTGLEAPRIVMPNGFTYHLQEMAFFSWFFGAPSVGLHGWFSNNGTFLTDAGPPCQSTASSSTARTTGGWIIR